MLLVSPAGLAAAVFDLQSQGLLGLGDYVRKPIARPTWPYDAAGANAAQVVRLLECVGENVAIPDLAPSGAGYFQGL